MKKTKLSGYQKLKIKIEELEEEKQFLIEHSQSSRAKTIRSLYKIKHNLI